MSKYYKINTGSEILKVRVSDHEPNEALRGSSDIELYTIDACNTKLSVIGQIEHICEKRNLDIALFEKIMNDHPDEEIKIINNPEIEVTKEFIEAYHQISGKGSMKRKEKLCEKYNLNSFHISQGYYKIIN